MMIAVRAVIQNVAACGDVALYMHAIAADSQCGCSHADDECEIRRQFP